MTQEQLQKKWHALQAQEVVGELETNMQTGLAEEEAGSRLDKYGKNAVEGGKRKSYIKMLLSQFLDPLVVVLIVAAVITLLLRHYIDSTVIFVVVIVNAIIGFVQEERAESAIEALSKMLKSEAVIIRGGTSRKLTADNVAPGDVILLQSGDKVPADIRLVETKNFQANESVLTGESAPASKNTNPVEEDVMIADRKCMAYSGTLVTNGSARGVVTATGNATEIGKISSLINEAPDISTPLTRRLAKFGLWLSIAVVIVSVATFGLGVVFGQDMVEMFLASVAIAVAMIPEGLPAIVTIILAVGVRRMADRNSIIRTLPSVETLGSVSVICSDKTGTLTANEMTVGRLYAANHDYEFGGVGYNPNDCCVTPVNSDDTEISSQAFHETLRCGMLCNDSSLEEKNGDFFAIGDPTEVALTVAGIKAGFVEEELYSSHRRLDAIPFDSANMYMATANERPGEGNVIYVKGSVEKLLRLSSSQLFDDGPGELDEEHVTKRAEALASQGLRVLAFARKVVPPEKTDVNDEDLTDLEFLGIMGMSDPARPEAINAIKECKRAGIEVKMITGDHVSTARAIAHDLGIGSKDLKALTGSDLAKLSEEDFEKEANEVSVFARVEPEQKYRLVESLQKNNKIVAMTGDGVNDAPALKKADIGVAMGKGGSEVAKDASDMVITDDNFASIVAAVEEGRTVFSNLRKTLTWLLPTNLGEGLIIVIALLGGFVMPVSPVQILWINTITAVTLALPLAFEPMEKGTMELRPRPQNAPLLDMGMYIRIVVVALCIVAGGFAIFWFDLQNGVSVAEAQTAAVATIVGYELFYLFSSRSERQPAWKIGWFSNPYVWLGVFLVVLLQLGFTYLPFMNTLFGSAPLPWYIWLEVIAVSAPVMLIVGTLKLVCYGKCDVN